MDYKEIRVPETINDIKLGQWQKFITVFEKNKENEDFLNKKMLEIFCGIDLKLLAGIKFSDYETTLTHLNSLLWVEQPLQRKFKLKGTDNKIVHFGLIPNLDKMSYGEFEDLENYIHNPKTLNRAMAVLFRPISLEIKGKYKVHEYKGTDFMAEVMKEMPLGIALGAKVFFYRLATKLGVYTMDYTLKECLTTESAQHPMGSGKNGVLTKEYSSFLKEMLEELTRLQN